ncbi:MAG: hypothetical protein V4593_08305 [Pseudomonadota bacterium]
MAILEIPTRTDGVPHYVQRTALEGTDYVFTFRFGERRGGWVFDLATLDGVRIVSGQLVLCGFQDLLRRAAMPERPPGVMWAMNVSEPPAGDAGGPFALPGLYDLGGPEGRCRLFYTESTTAAENAAAGVTSLDDL